MELIYFAHIILSLESSGAHKNTTTDIQQIQIQKKFFNSQTSPLPLHHKTQHMSCCEGSTSQSSSHTSIGRRRGTNPRVQTTNDSIKATEVERLEQKCVLIGNVAVGKSSLVNRYTRGDFLDHYQATIGAAFVPKEVELENDKSIKLQIWDTAGEEKYRAMTQFYYRKAAAGLVIFALDDRESFNQIKEWISDLRDIQPQVVIIVAGNKSDIEPDDRAVHSDEVDDLCDEMGVTYFEVSALDGSNVDMMFNDVAQQILDKPECWAT